MPLVPAHSRNLEGEIEEVIVILEICLFVSPFLWGIFVVLMVYFLWWSCRFLN